MSYASVDEYSEYRRVVSVFCYYVANLARFVKMKKNGTPIDSATFEHFIKCTAEYRKKVLQEKEKLELPGGVSFLEDNKFNGFSIEKGEISGDFHFADVITIPWLKGFPETANYYQFEVGCYIQMLIHPDCLDDEISFIFEQSKVSVKEMTKMQAGTTLRVIPGWMKKEVKRWTKRLCSKSSALVQVVQEAIS